LTTEPVQSEQEEMERVGEGEDGTLLVDTATLSEQRKKNFLTFAWD